MPAPVAWLDVWRRARVSGVNGLELAIRRALDKADRSNPEIRARIYQSARQALEAGLRKQEINDPTLIARHRHQLEETIRVVEAEEREASRVAPALELPADMTLDGPAETRGASSGPSGNLDGLRADRPERYEAPEPRPSTAEDDETPIAHVPPERRRAPRKHRRGFYTRLFMAAIVLAFVGMAGWWVMTSGLLMSAAERDTSVPNPPATVDGGSYDGTDAPAGTPTGLKTLGPQAGFTEDWIEIVGPEDAGKVTARSNAAAEAVATGDGPAILVTSSSAGDDGKVELPIGAGTAGKIGAAGDVQVALTVRGTADAPVEISVECGFGAPETCGRHRFLVPPQKTDILLTIPAAVLSEAGADAKLLLSSDVEGKGRGLDVFGVRVLPPQS